MKNDKNIIQILWGIVLTVTGILVILQIPEKFNQMGDIAPNNIFAKLCFYGLGILLILGGLKKVIIELKSTKNKPSLTDKA
ncbi:membrane protein [Candidatus Magnetomorum sp. HK-1]|nr:membrane protein [Candidatus Magnetomorum sp. HK-1]